MNLLLTCECTAALPIPDFGAEFTAHLCEKRNPQLYASSLTAWSLLAFALRHAGVSPLPKVAFLANGKPFFPESPLYFSLSHSRGLSAALLSNAPCGVDIQQILPQTAARLRMRTLSAREQALGLDFFVCWTRKEAIAKIDGRGIGAHPCAIDTLEPQYENRFFTARLADAEQNAYVLSAIGGDPAAVEWLRINPQALTA